jgi:hypothetical protein
MRGAQVFRHCGGSEGLAGMAELRPRPLFPGGAEEESRCLFFTRLF